MILDIGGFLFLKWYPLSIFRVLSEIMPCISDVLFWIRGKIYLWVYSVAAVYEFKIINRHY